MQLQDPSNRMDTPGRRIGFWLGLIGFIVMVLLPAPDGLTQGGWFTLALLFIMVVWWVSEALPIGVTSFLPLIIAPLFGIAAFSEAAPAYAHPIIFLLMGGFMIGKSIERWNLHERVALSILSRMGARPSAIIAGFMGTAALLSMWISNTATVIMLVPIILSLVATSTWPDADKKAFTLAVLLGTAWAASIGGLGTPVGTAPNLIIIGALEDMGDNRWGFLRWMMWGLPTVLIMVPAAYFVLTRWGPKMDIKADPEAEKFLHEKLAGLGKITTPERRVIFVFALVAFFWMFRRAFIQDMSVFGHQPFAGLNDSVIAMAGVVLLCALPSGAAKEPGTRLLDWPTAASIPWDVLFLFGGGLSLAACMKITGLSDWLGAEMAFVGALHPVLMTFFLVSFVIFFTELTSNTATAAALMPVIAAIALETGIDPAALAMPIAMAASCAFMLPMATGPNAIIFGSGKITIPEMARAGFKLNLLGIVLITLLSSALGQWLL